MLLPQAMTLFHFNLYMNTYKRNFIYFLSRNLNLQVRHNKNKKLTTFKLITLYKWHRPVCGSAVSVALTSGTPCCRSYILPFVSMAHHFFSSYLLYKTFLSFWMCSFLAGRKPLTFSFFFLLLIQGSQWQHRRSLDIHASGWLALLVGSCGEAGYGSKGLFQRAAYPLMMAGKWRGRWEGLRDKLIYFLQFGSTSGIFHHLP